MSSGSQDGTFNVSRSGFSKVGVESFLGRGNTQASRQSGSPSISSFRPQKSTIAKTEGNLNQAKAQLRLQGDNLFSDKVTSEGQLDALVNSFLKREKQISQRRSQFGRKGLFLGRQ